jgi:hypothetical protein
MPEPALHRVASYKQLTNSDDRQQEDLAMEYCCQVGGQMFRLWIATYDNWTPARWNNAPPMAVALEPVEDALYSASEAAMFLEGFNESMLECDKPIWAIAIPVTLRLEGDAHCGMHVRGHVFEDARPAVLPTAIDAKATSGCRVTATQGTHVDTAREHAGQ